LKVNGDWEVATFIQWIASHTRNPLRSIVVQMVVMGSKLGNNRWIISKRRQLF
jgi:hypothetical protein